MKGRGQEGEPGRPDEALAIPRGLVEAQVQRILSSELFAHSDRLRRLLQFVVAETLEGRRETLKEYNLGVAVFDRGASFDPRTDPIVRVEAGRLRNRLNDYYSSTGAGDPLVIELPKGSYSVTVQRRGVTPAPAAARRKFSLKAVAFVVVSVTACFALVQNVLLRRQLAGRSGPLPSEVAMLWAPFLSGPEETVIIFASPMFFESAAHRMFFRAYNLNDPSAAQGNQTFLKLQKLFGPLSDAQYPYAQTGDALAMARLGAFFGRYGRTPRVIPANLATWDSIKDKNLICVGPVRMMPVLHRLPVQLDFDVEPEKFALNRNPRPGEEERYATPSHTDVQSFAAIATAPGLDPGRELLVVTSHGSAGTFAGVEYLTGLDTLRELQVKLQPKAPGRQHYQILLRVLADKDEAFKTEYITSHQQN